MDWTSLISDAASITKTLLPLFVGLLEQDKTETKLGTFATSIPCGPCTAYRDPVNQKLMIGNLNQGAKSPVTVVLSSIEGAQPYISSATQLHTGKAIPALDYLNKYGGSNSLSLLKSSPTGHSIGDADESLVQFHYSLPLNVGGTFSAALSPTITAEVGLTSDAAQISITSNEQLGSNYSLSATNTVGNVGQTSGVLQGSGTYTIPLPSGINYSNGIYSLSMSLRVPVSITLFSSDPEIVLHDVPAELMR